MISEHFTNRYRVHFSGSLDLNWWILPKDTDMSDMGMNGTGLEKGVTWNLHNKTDPSCSNECVGDYYTIWNPENDMWDRKAHSNRTKITKEIRGTIICQRKK